MRTCAAGAGRRVPRGGHSAPPGGRPSGLLGEALLAVVELDVGLVHQRDGDAEAERSVRALHDVEAGVPAMEVALQAQDLLGELAGLEVVLGVPGGGPVRRRAEIERDRELLPTPGPEVRQRRRNAVPVRDRKSTRLNSSHPSISY